jgi:hypothetical protein
MAIERSIRSSGTRAGWAGFPGRRQLAALLHRLWKLSTAPDYGWSISRAEIGNRD